MKDIEKFETENVWSVNWDSEGAVTEWHVFSWLGDREYEAGQEWDTFSVAEKLLHKAASDDRKRHDTVPQSGSRIDERNLHGCS